MPLNLTQLVQDCHSYAKKQGFWDASQNIGEKLMLIVTELAEAMEDYRMGDWNYIGILHAPKENFAEELADVVIRICDLCGYLHIDLAEAVEKKIAYNESRPFLHGKRC